LVGTLLQTVVFFWSALEKNLDFAYMSWFFADRRPKSRGLSLMAKILKIMDRIETVSITFCNIGPRIEEFINIELRWVKRLRLGCNFTPDF